MRKSVAEKLYQLMSENDNIWLITADLGFGLWDKIRDEFPDRFINTGASEAAASDLCVGLSLSGKIPVMYSITPFLLFRCLETWRTYSNHERIKVILLGSGREDSYKHDGFSHFAGDDKLLFGKNALLNNFLAFWPQTNKDATERLEYAINADDPIYINLER